MESNSLRGLFGISSPHPVEQRVARQPTEPIENETPFEFPSAPRWVRHSYLSKGLR